MKRLILVACVATLTACGGSSDSTAHLDEAARKASQSIIYSFPDRGQLEVPVSSPVILRFSSPIVQTAPDSRVTLTRKGGGSVPFSARMVNNGMGLVLEPNARLEPLTEYQVSVQSLELKDGTAPAASFSFTTRAAQEGPRSWVARETFEVLRAIPDGRDLDVMDFSSFRLQFTQPLERSTVKYGDSIALLKGDQVVPAHLIVHAHYLTLDPKEDLTPGESYRLVMTPEVKSTYGQGLVKQGGFGSDYAYSLEVTPKQSGAPGTGERAYMVQDISSATQVSPLTGEQINLVPMKSTLLGQDTATQASGLLTAELGFVPRYPDAAPIRIKRGSVIVGESIDVLIGGVVPVPFKESGEVSMTFISDATGYLLPNSWSDLDEAPRQVRLWMDVAVSTEQPEANGSVTQDLMHIELVGTSMVEDGLMTINAVGVVEPSVMGQEYASGVLSFYMKEWPDQDNPPAEYVDDRPLLFQSWNLGEDVGLQMPKEKVLRAGDSIVLNFSKPLSPEGVAEKVFMAGSLDGEEVNLVDSVHVDGSALVVRPTADMLRADKDGSYRIEVSSELEDLQGNLLQTAVSLSFDKYKQAQSRERWRHDPTSGDYLPSGEMDSIPKRSVFVLGLYPGYPCALDERYRDLSADVMGRCAGGFHPLMDGWNLVDDREPDQLIPLAKNTPERPIVVVFSKPIDEGSVRYGTSFKVEEVDVEGNFVASVAGQLKIEKEDTLYFTPDEPWELGKLYRYVLFSNGDAMSSVANCSGHGEKASICDKDGLPLMTQMTPELSVEDPSARGLDTRYGNYLVNQEIDVPDVGGGKALAQYFRVTEGNQSVLQLLRLSHVWDKNANLVIDHTPSVVSPYVNSVEGALFKQIVLGVSGSTAEVYGVSGVGELDEVQWLSDTEDAALTDALGYGTPIDPEAVVPPVNSVKVLSSHYGLRDIPENIWDIGIPKEAGVAPQYGYGGNVGCGFKEAYRHSVGNEICENYGKSMTAFPLPPKYCFYREADICPKEKFTYLHGVVFAEVGSAAVGEDHVPVRIHPGHMVSTSFKVYTRSLFNWSGEIIDTGYQLMRMKFTDPAGIPAKLKEEAGGVVLTADVGIYMDAAGLARDVVRNKKITLAMNHSLYSYPVDLDLSGAVRFLQDGRLVVEQSNRNGFDINMRAEAPLTNLDLFVPAGGVNIQYLSQPIK